MRHCLAILTITAAAAGSCTQSHSTSDLQSTQQPMEIKSNAKLDTATFGNGCFWCTEAIFESLKGVESAVSGYSGGHVDNPSYKQVCSGETGHAEAIRIFFDPSVITYEELLEAFWASHDPTTLNRQGADVGPNTGPLFFIITNTKKHLLNN
jgi:peptide-methionine (S)-S-oxide reductase